MSTPVPRRTKDPRYYRNNRGLEEFPKLRPQYAMLSIKSHFRRGPGIPAYRFQKPLSPGRFYTIGDRPSD